MSEADAGDPGGPAGGGSDRAGIDAVAAIVSGSGVAARPLRQAIALLTEGPQRLGDLVRDCALPRRTVQALLRAAHPDLQTDVDGAAALRAEVVPSYRARFGYGQLRRTRQADPLGTLLAGRRPLTAELAEIVGRAPAGNTALDHVSATAETVLRRALWLDASFDLDGAHLLCLGDHDFTSLAVGMVNPRCRTTVVDVDDRLLDHIAATAAERYLPVSCWFADLGFGIPPGTLQSADLIFTDPPYTPAGVQLFLGRGLQALRDRGNGRLVMAYGFSPLAPALGVQGQQAIHDLDLAIEAILPAFNRYHGAQAVGSASDLYVCRPTARTWQILDRRLAKAAVNLYTRGERALEAGTGDLPEPVAAAALTVAGAESDEPVLLLGAGWPPGMTARPVSLGDLLSGQALRSPDRRRPRVAAANLVQDPGGWLLRTLLSVDADRIALVVPNNHRDLADERSQTALRDLVRAKYALRFRRSFPTPRHAIVEATSAGRDGGGLARWLLTHPSGALRNVLRDGLIHQAGERGEAPPTKNEARLLARSVVDDPAWLDARLLDLPRHAVRALLSAAETT